MTNPTARSVAGLTDVGQLRHVNEDAVLVNTELQLYVIADGMGGHGSGDVASQLAIETLQSCIGADSVRDALSNKDISSDQATALIYQGIVAVNQRIYKENVKNGHPDGTGMGTTLVGLCFFGDAASGSNSNSLTQPAIAFNIGDSRLYEYHNENLAQLTTDHTMYQDWKESGRVGPAPPRNIIMRAVGLFADVDIDMDVVAIRNDASYLLCSDGLTGMVSDRDIASMLDAPQDAQHISQALINAANKNGGNDNITVVTITPESSK